MNQSFIVRSSVRKHTCTIDKHEPFILESGVKLTGVKLAYETYGTLNEAGDNAVLICHALTGDSHPAAHTEIDGDPPGWWEPLIGPGRPIDTDRFYVIATNVLGGCQGSTGPWAINPSTGHPYGMEFPIITIRDMVKAQKRLLDILGVKRLYCVAGGSMGGMQALEWAIMYNGMVEKIIPIASCGRMTPQGIALNEVQRQAIKNDPHWKNGNYYYSEAPSAGLSTARMLGMITYQSDESMRMKFGRELQRQDSNRYSWDSIFKVESYLRYQGKKLVDRFDANTYIILTRAMDLHDVGYLRDEGYTGVLARIKAKALVIGISSDILFPTWQQTEIADAINQGGGEASYYEIRSEFGHDAFLIEYAKMNPVIEAFLR